MAISGVVLIEVYVVFCYELNIFLRIFRLPIKNKLVKVGTIVWNLITIVQWFYLLEELKSKFEYWTLPKDRLDFNSTTKLFDDLLWDVKSKADTMLVHLTRVFDVPKHFEELILILFLYTRTCIYHLDNKICIIIFLLFLSFDDHTTFVRKLESIGLQV